MLICGDTLIDSVHYSFLGIPYAQPPVHDLRFVKPVPFGYLGNVSATSYGPRCAQMAGDKVDGSEDCLTLDIYRPVSSTGKKVRRGHFVNNDEVNRCTYRDVLYQRLCLNGWQQW